MELIKLTHDNLSKEHICCAISSEKDIAVVSKKNWLSERFDDGLVFLKGNVRGKCFIEYIPAENAWAPIEADNYMYIDCFWVAGSLAGQGNANILLDACIADSKNKGKNGLVILSSQKKKGFLADSAFLTHKGFLPCDNCGEYFQLYYYPFSGTTIKPQFKNHLKEGIRLTEAKEGYTVYYSNQCPFTAKYVPLLKAVAEEKNVSFNDVHIRDKLFAQNAPSPFTVFSLFYNGRFVTHEILSEKKFGKMIDENKNIK